MQKNPNCSPETASLRRRAEDRLKAVPPEDSGRKTAADTQRLLHELQVHQIELEMQNEELREARAALEASVERYTDLYDFAPAGHFTLDRKGAITQTNLSGARLLGLERSRLQNQPFRLFVDELDRTAFDTFFQQVFASRATQLCEVTLEIKGQPARIVRIEAAFSADGEECRAVAVDITEPRQMKERIRQLVQHLEAVREDEHRRISHELNEDLGQILAALKMDLSMVCSACTSKDMMKPKIKEMQSLLSDGIQSVHSLCRQLRPGELDLLGLKEALINLIGDWQKHNGIECNIETELPDQELPERVKTAVFRIIEEALTNVSCYARASKVEIRLTSDNHTLRLSIADNGCGMEPAAQQKPAAFGLLGIRERVNGLNGTLHIENVSDAGIQIDVTIPLEQKSGAARREGSSHE